MSQSAKVSVNKGAFSIVQQLVVEADRYRVIVSKGSRGETLIDAGAAAKGGLEAGLKIAEICLGGLGHVSLTPYNASPKWPYNLTVRSADPIVACLASQYAGWSLSHGDFFALGSGPGRALSRVEPLFEDLGYKDEADCATLVLEGARFA